MMERKLAVFMGAQRAGTVECSVRASSFTYDRDYLATRGASPLSLSLPLRAGVHPPTAVDHFLWGLLPDNPETLQRWAVLASPQADEHNPFSLLQHYGRDCAGAVQFLTEGEKPDDAQEVQRVDDAAIGAQLRALNADPNAWTFDDADGRFSLAGAQAKFALVEVKGGWARAIGSTPTTHIVKPGIPKFREQALNEHLCLALARRLDLPAAHTQIRSFDGTHAIVVERYDRRVTPTGVERLHQEDLCQALSVSPSQKYQEDGGPGIIDLVRLFRRAQPQGRADATTHRYLFAVAFNWLIGAPDAHAKNYSLLVRGSAVALAPLYDIATITPYDSFTPNTARIAQAVDGKYRLADIDAQSWHAQATAVGLDGAKFVDDVRALASRAADAVASLCASPEVQAIDAPFAAELSSALQERIAVAQLQLH
ncbi:MAG: type II toxin-antitoxin system HipA family toxin [Rhodoglobus sp.]